MADRETPAALTVNQAARAIQRTSVDEFATENMAEERQQNQQFSAPGECASEKENPTT